MEVHPPHKPIHSIKEFMVHMLAITLGLLIALGLESMVEGVHHRHAAREARENIAREVQDNQRALADELAALPKEAENLDAILAKVNDLQHGRTPQAQREFSWRVTRLRQAAWDTAIATGATSHMSYDEVKRYSQVYTLHQLFNATMDRYLEERGRMFSFLALMNLPDRPSAAESEEGKRAIASQLVMGAYLKEIGEKLNRSCAELTPPGK